MLDLVPSVEQGPLAKSRLKSGNADDRARRDITSKHRRRSLLYIFGSSGSARLTLAEKQWLWTWLVKSSKARLIQHSSPARLCASAPHSAFAADNDLGVSSKPQTQAKHSNANRGSDKLVVVRHPHARYAQYLLCFPTGHDGEELNLSPFLPKTLAPSHGGVPFKFAPCDEPVLRFPSPILQIAASPVISTNRLDRASTCLLVRLESTTYLLNISPNPFFQPFSSASPVRATIVAEMSSTQTEGRRHVDVALDPKIWGRAIVVDEGGTVWLWYEEKRQVDDRMTKAVKLKKLRNMGQTSTTSGFYRVAFGTRPCTALVMSDSDLVLLNFNASSEFDATLTLQSFTLDFTGSTALVQLTGNDRFTSLDRGAASRRSGYTWLCTTEQLILFDEGAHGHQILRWRHERGGALQVVVVSDVAIGDVLLLYSPSSTIVDCVAISKDLPPRLLSEPSSATSFTSSHPVASLAVLPFKLASDVGSTTIVSLSPKDGLYLRKLFLEDLANVAPSSSPRVVGRTSLSRVLSIKNPGSQKRPAESNGIEDHCFQLSQGRWAWTTLGGETHLQTQTNPSLWKESLRDLSSSHRGLFTTAELARDVENRGNIESRSRLLHPLIINRADFLADADVGELARFVDDVPSLLVYPGPLAANTSALATVRSEALQHDISLSSHIGSFPESAGRPNASSTASSLGRLCLADDLFAEAAGQLTLEEKVSVVPVGSIPTQPPLTPFSTDVSNAAMPLSNTNFVADLIGEWDTASSPSSCKWQWARPRDDLLAMQSHTSNQVNPKANFEILSRPATFNSPFGRWQTLGSDKEPSVKGSPVDSATPQPSPTMFEIPSNTMSSEPDHSQIPRDSGSLDPRPDLRMAKKKAVRRRHGGF